MGVEGLDLIRNPHVLWKEPYYLCRHIFQRPLREEVQQILVVVAHEEEKVLLELVQP